MTNHSFPFMDCPVPMWELDLGELRRRIKSGSGRELSSDKEFAINEGDIESLSKIMKVLRVNRKCGDLFGSNFEKILTDEGKNSFSTLFRSIFEEDGSCEFSSFFRNSEGEKIPVRLTFTSLRDEMSYLFADLSMEKSVENVEVSSDRNFCFEDVSEIDKKICKQEFFNLVTENMNDVVWVMDKNFKLTYVSPSVQRMRGYTPDEVMSLPVEKLMSPRSYEKMKDFMAMAKQSIDEGDRELPDMKLHIEQPHKKGGFIVTELSVSPIFEDSGTFKYYLGVSRDITSLEKAEACFRKEELVADIIENMKRMSHQPLEKALIMGLEGAMELSESRGGFIYKVGSDSKLDLVARSGNIRNGFLKVIENSFSIRRALEEGEPVVSNRKRADLPFSRSLLIPFVSDGIPAMILGVTDSDSKYDNDHIKHLKALLDGFYRISCRKEMEKLLSESEQKFRTAVENAGEGIVIVNVEERWVEYVNPSATEMFGYSRSELEGMVIERMHSDENRHTAMEAFSVALESRTGYFTDILFRRKDGSEFAADVRTALVDYGDKVHLIAFVSPLT